MRLGFAVKLAGGLMSLLLVSPVPVSPASGADRYPASFLGSYTWHVAKPWFGGFSAIEMQQGGRQMLVLTDRATLLGAHVVRTDNQITGIRPGPPHRLKSSKGARLAGRVADSEGLAIGRDGTLYISFEGVARIARHKDADTSAKVLPRPDLFRTLPRNKSLESLAIDTQGRLYTLPENAPTAEGQIPVFRWNGHRWRTAFTLPARGDFLPVSADIGPDGRFYILERTYSIVGFQSRLRRWDLSARGINNEQVMFQTAFGTHDNLEGLSVWRTDAGRLRASMISDDNFKFFQITEIVEYALPD